MPKPNPNPKHLAEQARLVPVGLPPAARLAPLLSRLEPCLVRVRVRVRVRVSARVRVRVRARARVRVRVRVSLEPCRLVEERLIRADGRG